jgi:hypothetical protein
MKNLGEIAESKFLSKALFYGYSVSIPFGDNQPYDLILDDRGRLYKVQVKSTNGLHKDRNANSYKFVCARGARMKTRYEKHEVDLYALYVHPLDIWYLVPFHKVEGVSVRVYPHRTDYINGKYERYKERWQILYEN